MSQETTDPVCDIESLWQLFLKEKISKHTISDEHISGLRSIFFCGALAFHSTISAIYNLKDENFRDEKMRALQDELKRFCEGT